MNEYNMDGPIAYYLATGDPALGRRLATMAVGWMQGVVNYYLKQEGHTSSFGKAPHGTKNFFDSMLNLTDAALFADAMTDEERERIRAQAAFLGYVVQRPDYWSPARGFGANPNMTTFVAGFQTTIGCLISSHPLARTWVSEGLWLEAPHYAMASYDQISACFLMARNAGFADHVFDPRMKKIAEWFAKISTPPDARLKGWRHLPPIGNTYKFEPSSEFGHVASIWKERDPAFAAEMQWMFLQQGAQKMPSVGGFPAAFAGYRGLFIDTNIAAKAPAYGSELFPENGVVLRNAYPSERETMLHMIAGSHYQHYDYDSGSITLWGKGRIVADEFGYYDRAPVADQSMLETPLSSGLDMRIKEFAPSQQFDYVRGVLGGWTRQIAFIKDSDPLAPNYFVICDTLSKPAPATWRLWLTCTQVTLSAQGALVAGQEDVDTDVFFTRPAQVKLLTEEKTRKTYGLNTNAVYCQTQWTQTGLIATQAHGLGFTAVLYPRLKSEPPPKFTALADGQAVRVQTPAGTDYVFLSAEPFSFKEGDIAFTGTVGAIQTRGNGVILSLGAAGSIAAHGHCLAADKAAGATQGKIK
ncbi:MAG: hypothetical protein HYV35_02940 [Lentisphaerae bacterium]|nr:hypothetical protein [Lentisphaerota bacterium]